MGNRSMSTLADRGMNLGYYPSRGQGEAIICRFRRAAQGGAAQGAGAPIATATSVWVTKGAAAVGTAAGEYPYFN